MSDFSNHPCFGSRESAEDDGISRNERHSLKCWPSEFDGVVCRDKRFEYRTDDRGYRVGDELLLNEWEPAVFVDGRAVDGKFTGRHALVRVTWILRGAHGVPADHCVMSIDLVRVWKDKEATR